MQQDLGRSVLIAGGGLAGLAAAKSLVDAGYRVELLEGRSVLGGKVSAWQDGDGDWIESGLHTFFGAYVEIIALMRELGIEHHILWKEHKLTYTLAGGGRFDFTVGPLPPPLHLLPAVFNNRFFGWGEKARLARVLAPIIFGSRAYKDRQDRLTYREWHRRNGIGELMLAKMFLPMALALKFVPPEHISAKIVLDVMGIFLRTPRASRMGFLDGSPQERLIGPLVGYLTAQGARVRTGQKVRRLLAGPDGRVTGLLLEGGEVARADDYLLALPVHQLNRIAAAEFGAVDPFPRLARFEGVPVLTVQLWLDRQVTYIDNILFCPDGRIPVYADLGNTTPGYADEGRSRLQFVVAPAADLLDQDDEAIVARVWHDFAACFPDTAPAARIVKQSVVRIPQSVYWPKPGLDALRPGQRTAVPNLYLAGGYTRQDFYDSMEGAVASGRRAANALMNDA